MPVGAKGHVRAANKDGLIQFKQSQWGAKLRRLRQALGNPPAQYDSRVLNIIPAVKNQGGCGSCWDFSGTGVVEVALILAGILTPSQTLSEEYTLSCGHNGGCGGDDNVTVLEWAKATGLPLTSDYGPYTARRDRCNFKSGMPLFKIDEWGFCDSGSGEGVTKPDDIKRCIMTFGCVGCAVAAGGDQFWDDGQGIGSGTSHNIDHDVIIVGWDDTKGSKGAWIMRNSWDVIWGSMHGYGWVEYGAYDLGTESVWAHVKSVAPPVPLVIDWTTL